MQGFRKTCQTVAVAATFGPVLQKKVDPLEQQARGRARPLAGIQPHLVFRVPIAAGTSPATLIEALQELGISVVGIEHDGAIIAFNADMNLDAFRRALDAYTKGPRINRTTGLPFASTKWDVFQLIEADQLRLWSRRDRVGPRLRQAIGPEGRSIDHAQIYVLDVEFGIEARGRLPAMPLLSCVPSSNMDLREATVSAMLSSATAFVLLGFQSPV